MAMEARRLEAVDDVFGIQAASHLLGEVVAPWVQDLGVLVEAIESGRPAGAPQDWQPGAVLRLPFSAKLCRDGGVVCPQALMALADTAMMFAIAAAWSAYRPMSAGRPDHALPAAGEFRRVGRCADRPDRPHQLLRSRDVVECRRQATGRHGVECVCDVVARVEFSAGR